MLIVVEKYLLHALEATKDDACSIGFDTSVSYHEGYDFGNHQERFLKSAFIIIDLFKTVTDEQTLIGSSFH